MNRIFWKNDKTGENGYGAPISAEEGWKLASQLDRLCKGFRHWLSDRPVEFPNGIARDVINKGESK